jgi:RNA polymerase sigma-70 factor (ECF subfamily)
MMGPVPLPPGALAWGPRDRPPVPSPVERDMREIPGNLQPLAASGVKKMAETLPGTVTRLLQDVRQGDAEARERLGRLIYDELHGQAQRLMQQERAGHTWQPGDLVHEVFLRLLEGDVLAQAPNRQYLFGAAARAMRRLLVDHARRRGAGKGGGGRGRTFLDDCLAHYEGQGTDVLALHEALEALGGLHPRQRQVVDEHHFGGYTLAEIAEHLGVSEATVCTDFQRGLLWLRTRLGGTR